MFPQMSESVGDKPSEQGKKKLTHYLTIIGLGIAVVIVLFGKPIGSYFKEKLNPQDDATIEHDASGRATFTNFTKGYAITFPVGWNAISPKKQDILALPRRFDFEDVTRISDLPGNIAVSTQKRPDANSLDSLFREMTASIRYNSDIIDTGSATVADRKARWLVYDQIVYDEYTRTKVYLLDHDPWLLFIICNALRDEFEQYQPEFQQTIDHLQWISLETQKEASLLE